MTDNSNYRLICKTCHATFLVLSRLNFQTIKMKTLISFIFLAIGLTLLSCEKEKIINVPLPGELAGCWINPQYNDSTVVYERAVEFNNGPGIIFREDNSLVERKNAGFCGTPPVTYADYDGSYSVNDSIISVSVGYWGGTTEYNLGLVAVDADHLTVKWLYNNQ